MSTKSRSVSDPNAKGSSSFLWVIVALLVIAAIVIGIVVWQSQGQRTSHLADRELADVSAEMEYSDNTITLAASGADGAEEADLYEDFSCGYCGQLAQATDERMLEEIEAGNLIVNIHPMVFLDWGGGGTPASAAEASEGHSTAAAAAELALADKGEVDAFWNLREVMMTDQQEIFNQWGDEDFANAAAELGATDEAVEAIRNGDYLDEAKEVGIANAEKMQEAAGEVSTPRVIHDGEDIPNEQIDQWIDVVLE